MVKTLTFYDGTVLNGDAIQMDENLITLYLEPGSFAEYMPVVCDQNKTKQIVMLRYDKEIIFSGYTHLISISESPISKTVLVALKKA